MNNLENRMKYCYDLCIKQEIPVPEFNRITIKWNSRAKNRWGLCHRDLRKQLYTISINSVLKNVDVKKLEQTILHELCHTTPEGHGHKGQWKRYAERLNEAYGYKIKRTNSCEEFGLSTDEYKKQNAKYFFVCSGCGKVVSRKRQSDFTKHLDHYSCRKCGSVFKEAYMTKDGQLQLTI